MTHLIALLIGIVIGIYIHIAVTRMNKWEEEMERMYKEHDGWGKDYWEEEK